MTCDSILYDDIRTSASDRGRSTYVLSKRCPRWRSQGSQENLRVVSEIRNILRLVSYLLFVCSTLALFYDCLTIECYNTCFNDIYPGSKPSLGELTKLTYMKDGKEEKIEVIEVVAQQWMKFGTVGLGLEEYKVTNCHRIGQKDVDTCREVFQIFLRNGAKFESPTWRNVITAVRDADFSDLADNLEKALPLWYDQQKK